MTREYLVVFGLREDFEEELEVRFEVLAVDGSDARVELVGEESVGQLLGVEVGDVFEFGDAAEEGEELFGVDVLFDEEAVVVFFDLGRQVGRDEGLEVVEADLEHVFLVFGFAPRDAVELVFFDVGQDEVFLSDAGLVEDEGDGSLDGLLVDEDVGALVDLPLAFSAHHEACVDVVVEAGVLGFVFAAEALFFEVGHPEGLDVGVVELDPLVFDAV